jgi:hypothetical protein
MTVSYVAPVQERPLDRPCTSQMPDDPNDKGNQEKPKQNALY